MCETQFLCNLPGEMLIQLFADKTNAFAHGKGSNNSADAKAFDLMNADKGDQGSGSQTDHVKGDLYLGILEVLDYR